MMNGDNWSITRAEGGFIVYVSKQPDLPRDDYESPQPRVFTDTAALLNFLHNELVGSN